REVLQLIAAIGGPEEIGRVLDLALTGAPGGGTDVGLLDALVQTTLQRRLRPSGDLTRLSTLLSAPDVAVRASAARGAGAWQVGPLGERLTAMANDGAEKEPVRVAAIEGLAGLGGEENAGVIERLTQSDGPVAVRKAAVMGLATLNVEGGA